MSGKSYTNAIVESEVSISIEKLLVATWPTTWDKTKVDVSSPPAGFRDLGAVVEDTPSLTISRNVYQLKTGLPTTLQYEAVMNVEGKFEIGLYSSSNRKVKYALGNVAPMNLTADASPAIMGICNVASCTLQSLSWGGSGPVTTPVVNDWVVTGSSSFTTVESRYIFYSENEAQISSVNIASGMIYFASPGLVHTPLTGDRVVKLLGTKAPLGGSGIKRYSMLGVADFLNGAQVVHYFPKVSASGEWNEQVRPDGVGKIPLTFSLYGYANTDYDSGNENLIVGERIYFPETV